MEGQCDRDEGPENVHNHRDFRRASTADSEKLERVEAPAPAFSLWLNTLCDFVAIVIESWEGMVTVVCCLLGAWT